MINNNEKQRLFPASSRWVIFALSFVIMFLTVGILMGITGKFIIDLRWRILSMSLIQGLFMFILPTVITWRLTSSNSSREIGFNQDVSLKCIFWSVTLYLMALPAIDQTTFWNSNMSFPESMANLENTLRGWEESGAASTAAILDTNTIAGLFINIAIIGMFTGFAEEVFFRAGIQKIMIKSGLNPIAAIWISAIIFSAVHMQFFGFVPRMLLGAVFGYVYYRTSSIYANATLHALNNSIVVLFSWLEHADTISSDFDSLFVTESGFPWICAISTVAVILFIRLTRRYNPSRNVIKL